MALKIKDIAKMANVSVATVSRVLNNSDKVSLETKNKIIKIIQKYDYKPDRIATSLRSKKTGIYAVIFSVKGGKVLEDTYSTKFLKGVLNYFSSKGLKLIVDIHENGNVAEYYSNTIKSKIVDGFILLDIRKNDERVDLLNKEKFPYVVIGRNDENNFVYIDSDNVAGAYMAIKHLKQIKCKKILYISGNMGIPVSEQRLAGVKSAQKDLGVEVDVEFGDFDEEKTVEILKSILKKGFEYDGIFCASDIMAYSAMKFLRGLNIEVPIVGYDNIPLSEFVGLSTIDQNIIKIGYSAAQAVDNIANGKDTISMVVPSKLIKRQSTLSFIQKHI